MLVLCYTRLMDNEQAKNLIEEFDTFIGNDIFLVLLSLVVAYLASRVLIKIIVKVAQAVAVRADAAPNEKAVQLRRIETYLSVSLASIKFITILIVGYIIWSILSDTSSPRVAAIGASAIFIVIASGTVGPLLRDITAGSTMMIERWFNVGDFVRIEPFMDLGGVVERVSLRSTKIRSLNGEVIWLHNQHIQGVRMTPRGIRTLAVDIFVREPQAGRQLIERVLQALPKSTLTVANKIQIESEEKWGDKLYMMTVIGKTAPGREWLIEQYLVESLQDLDEQNEERILVRKPLVRYADAAAERTFKRAVRAK